MPRPRAIAFASTPAPLGPTPMHVRLHVADFMLRLMPAGANWRRPPSCAEVAEVREIVAMHICFKGSEYPYRGLGRSYNDPSIALGEAGSS